MISTKSILLAVIEYLKLFTLLNLLTTSILSAILYIPLKLIADATVLFTIVFSIALSLGINGAVVLITGKGDDEDETDSNLQ